ncbi:MAG: alpha/beta hydrolase [Lachnospiraceae bacterium]|nr:alpha/beta hydrolase [Lachnospiraceae bacterium]
MIKKESLYYESRSQGQKVHAIRWIPSGDIKAILFIAHGMAEYIDRYDAFATYLAERGILVAGCDYIGHGKSVVGQELYGYFCPRDAATVIIRDVHRLKKIIQADYPGLPQIIMGHSFGSFVVRNYLCRYGTGVNAAILMATGMPPKGLILVSRFLANLQAMFIGADKPGKFLNKLAFDGYNKRIKDAGSRFSWLSVNKENVEKYDADPLCGFIFTVNGFQTLSEMIYRLYNPKNLANMPADLPVLMVAGTEDPVGDYGEGTKRARKSLKKAGMRDTSLKLYPWGRHEILHEAEKDEVYQDIINWLNDKLDLKIEG